MNNIFQQAKQLIRDEKTADALELCNQEIQDSTNNALAYQGAAFALYRLGEIEKSMEMCKKALSLDPNLAFPHLILAEIFDDLGNIQARKQETKIALELAPEASEVLGTHGAFLLLDKKYDESIPVLEKTIKLDPNDYNAHNNLVVAYLHNKNKNKAYEHVKEIYRIRPSLIGGIRLAIAFLDIKSFFKISNFIFLVITIGAFIFQAWNLLIISGLYIFFLMSVGLVLSVSQKNLLSSKHPLCIAKNSPKTRVSLSKSS